MIPTDLIGWLVILVLILSIIGSAVRVLYEYQRGVIFRLGRASQGARLMFIIPFVDKMVKVSLRTVVMDVPPQDVITRDNVSMKVNAVIYFRVIEPGKGHHGGGELPVRHQPVRPDHAAQRARPGRAGRLLCERDKLNNALQEIIDQQTDPWGIKVSNVEVKHVDLPQEMQRAMARQAEAERERRAKVIHAEGEFQASQKLAEAAESSARKRALQLRYLQTLTEIATEKNSTIIFPLPIDLLKPFIDKNKQPD